MKPEIRPQDINLLRSLAYCLEYARQHPGTAAAENARAFIEAAGAALSPDLLDKMSALMTSTLNAI